jgi:LysR family transcriptional activator for leuABCD operon
MEVFMKQFDFNLLKVLDSLLTTRSVTRTATEMGLSAGAVSHALNRLRDQFNDPIMVRDGHTMVPTALACQLIPLGQEAVHHIEHFLNVARQKTSTGITRDFIRICCQDIVEILLIVPLLREMEENNISLEIISILGSKRPDYISDMHLRKFDILLDSIPVDDRSFKSTRLATTDASLVCSIYHPRIKDEITLEQLKQEKLIGNNDLYSFSTATGSVDVSDMDVIFSSPHMLSRYQAVASTDNLMLATTPVAYYFKEIFPLKILPVPIKHLALSNLYLTYHRSLERNKATMIFSQALKRFIEQNSASLHLIS